MFKSAALALSAAFALPSAALAATDGQAAEAMVADALCAGEQPLIFLPVSTESDDPSGRTAAILVRADGELESLAVLSTDRALALQLAACPERGAVARIVSRDEAAEAELAQTAAAPRRALGG